MYKATKSQQPTNYHYPTNEKCRNSLKYPCTIRPESNCEPKYEGVLISPSPGHEGNKLQQSNLGFIQHTLHKAQYTFKPTALTFASHSKIIQKVVRPTRSLQQQWPPCWTKMATFQLFFSVQGTGGSPTGRDWENGVDDQDTGSQDRPVSSGLQVASEPGHCRARTRPPWWPSHGVFPSKCPSITQGEMSNTLCWQFGP